MPRAFLDDGKPRGDGLAYEINLAGLFLGAFFTSKKVKLIMI